MSLISIFKHVSVLNRLEQKMIKGGAPGTCSALITNPENGRQALLAGVSKADVDDAISNGTGQGYRVQWCCDSCGSASWL